MTGLKESALKQFSEADWDYGTSAKEFDDWNETCSKWAEGYIKEHDRHMEQWYRTSNETPDAKEAIRESSSFLRGKTK